MLTRETVTFRDAGSASVSTGALASASALCRNWALCLRARGWVR
jgi:hypothetical protein